VARPDDESMLIGAWCLRDVKAGDFVRERDVQPFGLPASRPAQAAIDLDPGELKSVGDGLFVSGTMTAVAGRFVDDPLELPTPASAPGASERRPLASVGLGAIGGKVADAEVPEGATRIYAFRRAVPGGQADTAAYLVPLDLPAAERFYTARLARAGYTLLGRGKTLRGNGVALVFAKAGRNYFVNLHPADKKNRTKAVLVINRADAPATPAGGEPKSDRN